MNIFYFNVRIIVNVGMSMADMILKDGWFISNSMCTVQAHEKRYLGTFGCPFSLSST